VPDGTSAAPTDPPAGTRRRGATGFLLRAGAIAGAIASIVGVILLGVRGVHSIVGHKSGVNPVETLQLSVPRQSIHRETYAMWAKRNLGSKHPAAARAIARSPSANVPGVEVDYDIRAPKVSAGTVYRVTYTLLREPGGTQVGSPIVDEKRFTRRGDVCGCASAFIAVPQTKHLYRVEIQIEPKDSPDDNPAHRAQSETFRGSP